MGQRDCERIKQIEKLIEKKRIEIKKIKYKRNKINDKIDVVGNIYEYFVTPACAISISLVALFSGPIIYVLPSLTAVGAISIVSYKFLLRNKLDKLNKDIEKLNCS